MHLTHIAFPGGDTSAAPGDTILCRGEIATVVRVITHAPGASQIRAELHAVEIITTNGSRWVGSPTQPRIMGDLRMHWGAES